MIKLKIVLHNMVAHPIAGLLWVLGFGDAGDRVHRWWSAVMTDGADEGMRNVCWDGTPMKVKALVVATEKHPNTSEGAGPAIVFASEADRDSAWLLIRPQEGESQERRQIRLALEDCVNNARENGYPLAVEAIQEAMETVGITRRD